MPYFPIFIDLCEKDVLVVGGGKVATRKVKALLSFHPVLTVVAPEITAEIQEFSLQKKIHLISRTFCEEDLEGKFLVVVAVDDASLQERIYHLASQKGILCNSIDHVEHCHFLFPALILRGDLCIGLSSSGKSPSLSAALRKKLEDLLPPHLGTLLEELSRLRESLPKGGKRQKEMVSQAMELLEKIWEEKKTE